MTAEDWWLPIILSIIAAGPGLLAIRGQRQRDKRDDAAGVVDNAGKVTAQALTLIQPLNLRIAELEQKVIKLRTEADERDLKIEERDKVIDEQGLRLRKNERQIEQFKFGIKKLINQILRLGHVPEWQPDFIDEE